MQFRAVKLTPKASKNLVSFFCNFCNFISKIFAKSFSRFSQVPDVAALQCGAGFALTATTVFQQNEHL